MLARPPGRFTVFSPGTISTQLLEAARNEFSNRERLNNIWSSVTFASVQLPEETAS
jgi:hypothetical protein